MAVIGARPVTGLGLLGRRPRHGRRPTYRLAEKRRVRRLPGVPAVLVAILAAAGLGLFYLSQSTHVAATGYEINTLQRRISDLAVERQQLLVQIGQARSPSTIQQRAIEDLGLVVIDQALVTFTIPPPSTDHSR
jgi:cell division protein FtsB